MKNRIIVVLVVFCILIIILSGACPAFAQSSSTPLDPLTIPKFENQLTGPMPIFEPTVVTDNVKVVRHEYSVTMTSFKEQILPTSMNLLTPVWGYGGMAKDALTGKSLGYVESSPGPTFEAVRGVPIQVKWQNNITDPYMFPVDPTIHWANPDNYGMPMAPFQQYPPGYPEVQSRVPLVTHLHGGETQSYYDGTPEEWFTANGIHGSAYSTFEKTDANAAVYYYDNMQQPTTLWYHDHALGVTRLSVMSGLAGFYLIREPNSTNDNVAPLLPNGSYEMPLMIQDRSFNSDGSLLYPTVGVNPDDHPYWYHAFLGNTIVVNGKVWPNMNVDKGQYRFRLVDASNARVYIPSFLNTQTNQLIPFTQIGTDGGYLKAPVTLTNLTISPAERADILVDFSNLPAGTKVLLQNSALVSLDPQNRDPQTVGKIMQFTVTANEGFKANTLPSLLNPTLAGSTFPNLPAPTKQRILTLSEDMGPSGPTIALLNGQKWDGVISELPQVGTTEDWVLVDNATSAHPIHIHLVQFQLVSRQSLNATEYPKDWVELQRKALGNESAVPPWPLNYVPRELPIEPYLIGNPAPPAPNEQGWKDTILVHISEVVIVRIRFSSQDGSPFPFDATQGPGYVWHCHLIEHEDNEMMRPYKLISANQGYSMESILVISAIIVAAIIVAAILLLLYRRKKVRV